MLGAVPSRNINRASDNAARVTSAAARPSSRMREIAVRVSWLGNCP